MSNKTIFINGRIYTSRSKRPAQAIAVEDGIIREIGTKTQIKPLARRGFKIVDLKGKTVIPGIIDSHLHLLGLGNLFSRINLDGIDSLDEVRNIIRRAALRLKEGQWLRGRGWNKNLWGEDFPDKSVLDDLSNNPIALNSKDGHLLWVNSVALKLAGITENTPDPPGGVILKDSDGNPTGILQENAADLVTEKIPHQMSGERKEAILAAQNHLLQFGIIGVGDCDTSASLIPVYEELEKEGRLSLRIFKMIEPDDLESAGQSGLRTGAGSEHFRTGCLKLFADGAIGSQTALMFRPYNRSDGNAGVETLTPAQLENYIWKAAEFGISSAVHAIGDKANFQVLQAYENLKSKIARYGLRMRIEHAQILRKREISLFARYNVIAAMQPIHATSDRDISDRYLGARGRFAYAFKSLMRSGAVLAFGSDAPIETADPFAGIHAAATRMRAGETRKAWYPEERITVSQALGAYTTGAAYACCFDDITGGLAVGKRADFVIISDDVFKVKPTDIWKIKALGTVIDGRFVYRGDGI